MHCVWSYLFWDVSDVPARPVVDNPPAGLEAKEHGAFEQRHLAFEPQRRAKALDTPGCSTSRTDHWVGRVHHRNEQVEHDDWGQAEVASKHHVQQVDVTSCLRTVTSPGVHPAGICVRRTGPSPSFLFPPFPFPPLVSLPLFSPPLPFRSRVPFKPTRGSEGAL